MNNLEIFLEELNNVETLDQRLTIQHVGQRLKNLGTSHQQTIKAKERQ